MYIKAVKIILLVSIILGSMSPAWGFEEEGIYEQISPGEWVLTQKGMNMSPPLDPDLLNKLKNEENVLAVYGEIPQKEGSESYDWFIALNTIASATAKDSAMAELFDEYCINGIRVDADGYIAIEILEG